MPLRRGHTSSSWPPWRRSHRRRHRRCNAFWETGRAGPVLADSPIRARPCQRAGDDPLSAGSGRISEAAPVRCDRCWVPVGAVETLHRISRGDVAACDEDQRDDRGDPGVQHGSQHRPAHAELDRAAADERCQHLAREEPVAGRPRVDDDVLERPGLREPNAEGQRRRTEDHSQHRAEDGPAGDTAEGRPWRSRATQHRCCRGRTTTTWRCPATEPRQARARMSLARRNAAAPAVGR